MKLYVAYDPDTGQIVHTHASYLLGNDDPVAADENEILALAPARERGVRNLKVAVAPADFDVRNRLQALKVDPGSGEVYVVRRDRPGPERVTSDGHHDR
jgi:hypothetical protein